jgi:hypothetical protein
MESGVFEFSILTLKLHIALPPLRPGGRKTKAGVMVKEGGLTRREGRAGKWKYVKKCSQLLLHQGRWSLLMWWKIVKLGKLYAG